MNDTPSGIIDLSDLLSDKPVFFAFKFIGMQGTNQGIWTIKNFLISSVLTTGVSKTIVSTMTDAAWKEISIKNSATKWTQNTTQLQMAGGAATNAENEDWIVSRPIYIDRIKPDAGVGIKDLSGKINDYFYVFKTPGEYKVTFVASNTNITGSKTVKKEYTITVVP